MDHIRASRFQCLDLVVAEMYAVRESDVTAGQSDAVQICDVPQSTFLLDEFAFGPVFRRMRMDHHATRSRQLRNLFQQLTRATDRKTRRETVADTTTSFAVPFIEQG